MPNSITASLSCKQSFSAKATLVENNYMPRLLKIADAVLLRYNFEHDHHAHPKPKC